tara:strand:+ start:7474 stop:8559 length:1086 start_codon:yes stop_codon:yes gene_type:complete
MNAMTTEQMLSTLVSIKDKQDAPTQQLITQCEEGGEAMAGFVSVLYENLATSIKAELDAKEKAEALKKQKEDSWLKVVEDFKEDNRDPSEETHKHYCELLGIKVRNQGEKADDEVFDPIYYLAPPKEGKTMRKKVRFDGDFYTISAQTLYGLINHFKDLKEKHDADFDKKVEASKKKKKSSGGGARVRKERSDDDEVWVVNANKKDELVAKYDKIESGEITGYFMKEDKGIVYEKYDKRYPSGSKDPRDTSKTLENDLVKYRLTACIRTTPFSYPQDSGMCQGAVQWTEGKGKDTSKWTNRVGINNDPMVQCSQKATDGLYCAKCAKKSKKFNLFTDTFKKSSEKLVEMIEKGEVVGQTKE